MEENPNQITLEFNYPEFIKPALFNNDTISVIPAGRQTGKTYNSGQWIIEDLLTADEETRKNIELNALWVDTTNVNIEKYVERVFKKILKPIWPLCKWGGRNSKVLYLPPFREQTPYIDFGSAERPENLEGQKYYRGVLNEAGIILKKPSLWDNTLEPMFKNDKTQVKIIGTPKGRNKFHSLSLQNPTYHYTVYDSPFWTESQIKKKKAKSTELAWKQEYMAEFLENTGSIFKGISDCIKEIRTTEADIMGIDLAKYDDYTVIIAANSHTKEVVNIERFNQIDWNFQKKKIYDTWVRYKKPKVMIDSTGVGDAVYDDLKKANMNIVPFKFTNASKKELIENLALAIQNISIFIPKNDILIGELEAYEYTLTKSGNVTMSAPEGLHDDTVIALALTNRLMQDYTPIEISFV